MPMRKHKHRKRFGQHFLASEAIIERIVDTIHPKEHQHFIEIGPGQGALTKHLIDACPKLQLIEIDRDLVKDLKVLLIDKPEITIHEQDVLTTDFATLCPANDKLRLIGNLPYNISTPLLFHLFKQPQVIQDMTFMFQREVVVRLNAEPGNKDYGRLSVMAQYHCKIDYCFDVPAEAFDPPPKVESAIVRLTPHSEKTHGAEDELLFASVVKTAFLQRRKTLRNALKEVATAEDFEQANILPTQRPETLSVADFVRLSNLIHARRDTESGQ